MIDVLGGLFKAITIGKRVLVQVIHESVREFFMKSQKAAEMMELPSVRGFIEYSHEQIVAASGNYFAIMEMRRPLPPLDPDGQIAVGKLAAMLHRPVMIDFKSFAKYSITYFHAFIFAHMKEKLKISSANFIDRREPGYINPRAIFEGWLVFLYYSIVQKGTISSQQDQTFDLLYQDASMVQLSIQQLSRIITSVNNLIIFVNKAMKDGFVLNDASVTLRQHMRLDEAAPVYLRYFAENRIRISSRPTVYHNSRDGSWEKYSLHARLPRILGSKNDLVLMFCLVAENSAFLTDLERSWMRGGFPSTNVPLKDWQIVETLQTTEQNWPFGGGFLFCGRKKTLYENPNKLRWSLTVLKAKPLSLSGDFTLLRPICQDSSTAEDELETWMIASTEFQILTVRDDWEVRHYALKKVRSEAEQREISSNSDEKQE